MIETRSMTSVQPDLGTISPKDRSLLAMGIGNLLRRLFTVRYNPEPTFRSFLSRKTQDGPVAEVTTAVADADESERLFGVPLARRGLQPVYLRVHNHSDKHLRLHLVSIDPNYYTPLEAAAGSITFRSVSVCPVSGSPPGCCFGRSWCCCRSSSSPPIARTAA